MPITIIDILKQLNRNGNVSLDSFFYILDSGDIDFRINGIQEDGTFGYF